MEEIYLIDLKFDTFDAGDEPEDPLMATIAEARIYSDTEGEVYCSVVDYDGYTDEFYKTDRSTIDEQVFFKGKNNSYSLGAYLDDHQLEYVCYEDFYKDKDYELRDVYRLLIYLCRVSEAEREYMIDYADGKCMHEVDVPVCDVEKENS